MQLCHCDNGRCKETTAGKPCTSIGCGNQFEYHCPRCGRCHALEVVAQIWVVLTPDGSLADESDDGSHDWDEESAAKCTDCLWCGHVKDLLNGDEPADDGPLPCSRGGTWHNWMKDGSCTDCDAKR